MFKKIILGILFLSLIACSSEDLETSNFGSSYYKNHYLISNLSDQDINVYMANSELDGDKRDPFKDKYRVAQTLKHNSAKSIHHEHNVGRKISIGIEAPFSQKGQRDRSTHKVSNDRNYHLLVFGTQDKIGHRLISKDNQTENAKISVRVVTFETGLQVKHDETSHVLVAGEVSPFIRLEQCLNTLILNNIELDLCDGDYGRSYLLVVNAEGVFSLIPED